MKIKINIQKGLTEQSVMENALNQLHSGVDFNQVFLLVSFYFMGTSSPRALYYLIMLENENNKIQNPQEIKQGGNP